MSSTWRAAHAGISPPFIDERVAIVTAESSVIERLVSVVAEAPLPRTAHAYRILERVNEGEVAARWLVFRVLCTFMILLARSPS
ncbi:hypothetical protein [Microcella sp.]